jgi:hypothetical protein
VRAFWRYREFSTIPKFGESAKKSTQRGGKRVVLAVPEGTRVNNRLPTTQNLALSSSRRCNGEYLLAGVMIAPFLIDASASLWRP